MSGEQESIEGNGKATVQRIADILAGSELRAATLAELQAAAMLNALRECNGNRTRAAAKLGISVRTLQRNLKRMGYNDPPR